MFFRYLFIIITLSSCSGFYALHAKSAIPAELAFIELDEPKNLSESELFEHIDNLIRKQDNNEKKYLLKITITNNSFPVSISKNSDILRNGINFIVNYKLIDKKTQTVISQKNTRLVSSYDTIEGAFMSYVANEKINNNLLKLAAEQIVNDIAIKFYKKS